YVVLGTSFADGSMFDFPSATPSLDPAGFIVPAPSGLFFGATVTSPGDFSGDARGDIVIGAPGSGPMTIAGGVFTVLGRSYPGAATGLAPIPTSEVVSLATGAPSAFGQIVATLGDVNGDTRPDIGVWNATNPGDVTIFHQRLSG